MRDPSDMVRRPPRMEPAHPGRILARILEGDEDNAAVPVVAAAKALGVSRQTLHRVLAGSTVITLDMARRIGAFVGNGPGLWLRMQNTYDVWHAERASKLTPQVVPISEARKGRVAVAARKKAGLPHAAKRAPKGARTKARA